MNVNDDQRKIKVNMSTADYPGKYTKTTDGIILV